MHRSKTLLGHYPVEDFVRVKFGRSALFVQSALPGFCSPLTPDELADLACEDEVESRLVTHTRDVDKKGNKVVNPYRLSHGPFTPELFATLGDEAWTILVQDVDKLVPEVHALLDLVRFLPRWSIDDIMISYAMRGGSVGPHTDRYDVFLLQVQGNRRWQIAQKFDDARLREDTDLRVLSDFQPEEEFLARPGDVLYLPPGIAHYGVAEDECMTYSFGFRAPTEASLVSYFCDEMSALAGDLQLSESKRNSVVCGAGLSSELLRNARQMIQARFEELMNNERTVGRYLTMPKTHLEASRTGSPQTWAQLRGLIAQGKNLTRNIASRFLYSVEGEEVTLFVDGQDYALGRGQDALQLAVRLSEDSPNEAVDPMGGRDVPAFSALILELVSRGALVLQD